MKFEMRFEGARAVHLPVTGELVKSGEDCTIDEQQLIMLADAGYIIGPRSPYVLVDPDHTREVVVAHKRLEIQDEDKNTRVWGEPFEASDKYLAEMHQLLFNGRLVEVDEFDGELGAAPEEPDPEADEGEPEAELTADQRIAQALESDNYNVMRAAVADLSDEPATGNKADIRRRLEVLRDKLEG